MQSDARNPEVQNRYEALLQKDKEASEFSPRLSFSGNEANPFFHNDGRSLVEVGTTMGISRTEDGRGFVLVDLDRDGALDVVLHNNTFNPVVALLNRAAGGNAWLRVRLRGTKSNRFGIGARVTANGRVQELHAGTGYSSGNAPELHFGLGAAAAADVTVRWPSGRIDAWKAVPANREVTLTEGDPNAAAAELARVDLPAGPAAPPAPPELDPRALLETLTTLDGAPATAGPLPVILVLFRLNCMACHEELKRGAEVEARAARAGARVAWVSVDAQAARVRELFALPTAPRIVPHRCAVAPPDVEVPTAYLIEGTRVEKFVGRHAVAAALEAATGNK